MNSRMPPVAFPYAATEITPAREKPINLRQILHFLTANASLVALLTVLFVAAAGTYAVLAPPTFISSAQLMLQSEGTGATDVQREAEDAFIESQMEIMKSNDVMLAVVRDKKLVQDPEFQSDRLPVAEMLRSLLPRLNENWKTQTRAAHKPDEQLENVTIAILRSQLWIRRVGQSTVVEMSVASNDPEKAAQLANAVAEQYIAQNIRMQSQSALMSSQWLEKRVEDIRGSVLAADQAVLEFQSSGDASTQFKLAELKSVADTYRQLYESYLQKWSEAKQRISYTVPDAIFVSRASVPVAKSQPRTVLLLVFATVLGICSGIVLAIVRHFSDRSVVGAERIAAEVYAPCIGQIARVRRSRFRKETETAKLLGLHRSKSGASLRAFDHDVRNLRATVSGLRRTQKAQLIGVVGAEVGAGATTIAFNLALLSSLAGSRTLLVDACSTNPVLSATFGNAAPGFMDILNDSGAYQNFLCQADQSPLTVLAIGIYGEVTPGARLGSERVAFNLEELKEHFDLILVDLPALPGSADAKSIAPHLDGAIVVARYGKSSLDTLLDVTDTLRGVGADVLGVVLNQVPQRKI